MVRRSDRKIKGAFILRLGVCGFVIGLGLFTVAAGPSKETVTFPEFKYYEVGRGGTNLSQTSLVDIDRDGDLDWVLGQQNGDIWWFEYTGSGSWVRHKLGDKAPTEAGGTTFDVDGDGWIDQVSGGAWYRNTGKPREQEFIKYPNGAMNGAHDNVAADIDGDRKLEVVALWDRQGLFWYKIPADPTKEWVAHRIADGVHGAIGPHGIGDLDGDGDADIVRTNIWLENKDGKGTEWVEHKAFDFGLTGVPFPLTTRSYIVDLDKDGDMDVVMGECDCDRGRIAWFENKDGKGREWVRYIIAETDQDLHSLCLADFDLDGDPDIFSGGSGPFSKAPPRCIIWENLDGRGGAWKEHTILEGRRCHETVAGDVDGDGDIDICIKPWSGDFPYVYMENLLKKPADRTKK